jgi:CRP/FNR family cyclic AMP-dependent transcriptional regulator
MTYRSEPVPVSLLPALRTHVWFASCPPEFQTALVTQGRLVHVAEGATLFHVDDFLDGLTCVVAGAIKMCSVDPVDGHQRLVMYLEPYHWFGEVSLIDGIPRGMLVVADTPCTVLVIQRGPLEAWLDEHPQHWRDVARLACGKTRLMVAAMEDRAVLSLHQRLARRLLFAAANFGQTPSSTGVRKRLRLPQTYLAQMLGVSRQSTNKALRDLEREDVLTLHYAEIEIRNLEALIAKAGHISPYLTQMLKRQP